jgi:hypothetical protein
VSFRSLGSFLVAVTLGFPLAARGQQPPSLTPAQHQQVEQGQPVQVLIPVETGWPRSIVYQFIAAPPEVCAAVLADYELQSSYTPRLKSSKIVKRATPDMDVEYVVDIPLYTDERSVSRQRVLVSGAEYRVNWKTVPDPAHPGSVTTGSATFRPMHNARTGRDGTLMIHDQLVVPSSVFAKVPFVRNKGIEASRDIAGAIRKQIEHEVASEPMRVRDQVARLRAMVVRSDSSAKP